MLRSEYCDVIAIASRTIEKVQTVAENLGIPKAYGSYDELLTDPDVDAVYNPLPNHLHVPWTIKALEAGKHVLCEKPIGLTAGEAETLQAVAGRHADLKIMEAFMYRHHPQWQRVRRLVTEGKIGTLRAIQSFFSSYNVDPGDIRNRAGMGGGALLDMGCYCISIARFIFDAEPQKVWGMMENDPQFKTDRTTSGVLGFAEGISTFTCSTQLTPYQRVHIFGTEGKIEIEIPINAPSDKVCRIWLQRKGELEEIDFEICDQYLIQGDLFSQAVLHNIVMPTPLEDAVANMKVIDKIRRSTQSGNWI